MPTDITFTMQQESNICVTDTAVSINHTLNLLKPNDIYICRTAALTSRRYILNIYSTNIIIIIGIQPLGRSGQRPELSQATGMALVRCILGKFLGVVCHCFPPQQIYILNILNMLHNLRFFSSSKCRLFHNATLFGSCIIRILPTECAKI